MGLFKWSILVGDFDSIADGYAYAEDIEDIYEELKWKYSNSYEKVHVEGKYSRFYEFTESDFEALKTLEWEEMLNIKYAVRWHK